MLATSYTKHKAEKIFTILELTPKKVQSKWNKSFEKIFKIISKQHADTKNLAKKKTELQQKLC